MKWSSQGTLGLDLIRETQGFFLVSDHLNLGLYRSRLTNASSRRGLPSFWICNRLCSLPMEN